MSIYKGSTKLDTIAKGGSNLSGIYLGNDKIRPTGWQPGANTIAYYPLNQTDTYKDKSGNTPAKDLTAYNMSYNSISAVFPTGNTGGSYFYRSDIGFSNGQSFYFGVWAYQTSDNNARLIAPPNRGVRICLGGNDENGIAYGGENLGTPSIMIYNHTSVYRNKWAYFYYTGTIGGAGQGGVISSSGDHFYGTTNSCNQLSSSIFIGTNGSSSHRRYDSLSGNMSNLIIENKVWTTTDIMNYYNQTKSLYGIS